MTMTLAEFLAARYDEDEAERHDVHRSSCSMASPHWDYCDCGYPARVLCEVEAGRKRLAEHAPVRTSGRVCCVTCLGSCTFYPCQTLRIDAAVFSGHPDYYEAWRP